MSADASPPRSTFVTGRPATSAIAAVLVPALAGCAGPQSALDPQGPDAAAIALIWWVMFAGAVVIFVAVMALAMYAMYRAPERRVGLRPYALVIGGGLVFPVVTLFALLVYGVHVGRVLVEEPATPPLRIEVIGHQWWWEVRYPDADPPVMTANEIYMPVGRRVELSLESSDVIHSFWVPQLAGKTDLIPGKRNQLRLTASVPGVFLGQCAEFCGLLHAHMRLVAVALPLDEFDDWLVGRVSPQPVAQDASLAPALERFASLGCGDCHGIAGANAAMRHASAPDLSFYGARVALRSGAGDRDRLHLAAWLEQRHPFELRSRFGEVRVPTADEASELVTLLEALQ
jgi:cytochrome c oxidase subunit II